MPFFEIKIQLAGELNGAFKRSRDFPGVDNCIDCFISQYVDVYRTGREPLREECDKEYARENFIHEDLLCGSFKAAG